MMTPVKPVAGRRGSRFLLAPIRDSRDALFAMRIYVAGRCALTQCQIDLTEGLLAGTIDEDSERQPCSCAACVGAREAVFDPADQMKGRMMTERWIKAPSVPAKIDFNALRDDGWSDPTADADMD
jgi:hypothetical protein